jgi:type IV secretion system protein VirB3
MPIAVHPLFVGLTRPPMRFGVTLNALVFNGGLSLLLFVLSSSFVAAGFLAALLHAIGYVACRYEPRLFELLLGKFHTRCLQRNQRYWGCVSYDPF